MEDELIFDDFDTQEDVVDDVIDPIVPEGDEPKEKEESKEEPKKPKGKPKAEKPVVPEVKEEVKPDTKDEPEVEEGYIKSLAARQGIEIPEGMEFEDSEEGLAEYNEYVTDLKSDTKLNNYFSSLPPVAGEFFDYLQMLGEDATEDKIKAFFNTVNPEINYEEVDLENELTQKAVLKSFYKKNDYTEDQITKKLDKFEIAGILKEEAEEAADKLAKLQKKERTSLLEQEQKAEKQRKENTQKFFGNIKQVIESGKVNNFTIPVTERRAQFDYDVQGGFMNDLNEILKDPTRRLELAIAVKNKFNLGKFVNQAAATQKATSLSAKLKTANGTAKNGASHGNVTNNQIDWDNL